jgi:DNA-binding response OmpR family regulator
MKWSLLYFDDQQANLDLYREILSDHFHVHGCASPDVYESYIREQYPHAIIIDIHMPRMDGFSLFEKITKHPEYNGCPIFFISGDESNENKINSYKSGAIDFLPRDLKYEQLLMALSHKIKIFLQVTTKLVMGNLRINLENLKVTLNGKNVDVTLLEMRVLTSLIREFPEPISRDEMLRKIWGDESVKPGTVSTHLANLRIKMEDWTHTIAIKKNFIKIMKKNQ